MRTWKGRSHSKKEQSNKNSIKMRRHRKIIYVEVDTEDFNQRKSTYDSDSSIDCDQEEDNDCYYG